MLYMKELLAPVLSVAAAVVLKASAAPSDETCSSEGGCCAMTKLLMREGVQLYSFGGCLRVGFVFFSVVSE
jgi:hypothetical protein